MAVVAEGRVVATDAAAIRVVVADSRRLIAEALASVIAGADAAIEPVTVVTGRIAVAAVARSAPDLVLVGVGSDVPGSLAFIDALAPFVPAPRIVLIADAASHELITAVLERGLGGLLLTEHPADALAASLRHIAQGRAVLPSGWQGALARLPDCPLDTLSERQLEVLRLLAEGRSYEEIGQALFITVNTVKFHTRSIFERLGVHNRTAAARVLAQSTSG